jgi:hypothetical protein
MPLLVRLVAIGAFLGPVSAWAAFNGCYPGICNTVLASLGGNPGFTNNAAVTPPPPTCTGTGFDFSVSCNSQYLAIGGLF